MEEKIQFNDIGISSQLDYNRIKKLLTFGIIGALLNFAGDFLLGYGEENEALSGIERIFSKYASGSDTSMFWSAFLGLIGITLGGLSLFGIYRIIAGHSNHLAHHYRTGIFGYLIFGPLYHVLFLAEGFFYKYLYNLSPENAFSISVKSILYFVLPDLILFTIFFCYLIITMIVAFAKGKSDYPGWCALFNPFTIMIICLPLSFISNSVVSGITSGWISLGMLFMFLGLLLMTKKLNLGENKHI